MSDLTRLAGAALLTGAIASPVLAQDKTVAMVTYRGCEEACQGFQDRMAELDTPGSVTVDVRDIDRNADLLPGILEELKTERPDLVVTWGTTVSTQLLGTMSEEGDGSRLGDIPALFMIVAAPPESDLIADYDATGRPAVTGVRNRVPEETQLLAMLDYMTPAVVGLVTHPDEANSIQNAEVVGNLAPDLGFETVTASYTLGAEGTADPAQIPEVIAGLAAQGAEAIYVGSSSYTLEHAEAFTEAAVAAGLPVFTAYEEMVRGGAALMSISAPYDAVGRLAAERAAQILFEGTVAGDLPVVGLERYSIVINMDTARRLEAFPPMALLGLAEVVQ